MAGGFFTRLGALATAPRTLARRDLERRDGKAGDDLIVLALVALALDGAPTLLRAALALGAGRRSGALQLLVSALRPATPLVLMWLCASLLLLLFTLRSGRRAVGELGVRVTSGFVLTSLLIAPIASALAPGTARFVVTSLPWAAGAALFGLVLREALDELPAAAPANEEPPPWRAPLRAIRAGAVLPPILLIAGLIHVLMALHSAGGDDEIFAKRGEPAPLVDLPLLDGGRLQIASLRGRRVVLSFWATWCGPCLEELPALARAYRERGADAAVLYAVNVDEPGPTREAAVRKVVARLGLDFPIALDDGSASRAYSVSAIPTTMRIDDAGRLAQVIEGPRQLPDLRDALR